MQVQFEIADVTKRNYPAESFDVVYSRDTILHIKDKPALFAKFLVRKCISEKLVQVTLHFRQAGAVDFAANVYTIIRIQL